MNKKNKELKQLAVVLFEVAVTIVMVCMVLMIFVNAMMRYLFNSGIAVFEELSRYAFVWVSILGAIIAYYQNKHVGVDLLVEKMHGIAKLIIQILCELLVVFSLLVLCYGGWQYFIATFTQDSAALPIPIGIITVTPLVMGIAMLPKTVLLIKGHLDEYRTGKTVSTEETGVVQE